MDDGEILSLYCKRSETAISETAAKYSNYCYRIAHNILKNNEDAEECVNDTYMRAWEAIPPARPARLSTFLGKITRNLSLNMYQKYNAEKRGFGQIEIALSELEECIPDIATTIEQAAESTLIIQTLNVFLADINKTNRKIFVRRYWYMSSIEEIASDYNMSSNHIKVVLYRMRKKLKSIFEKEGIFL